MNETHFIVSMLVIAAGCSAASDGGEALGESAQALTSGHAYNFGTLVRSGACMDAASAGTADGTHIQEGTCNGTSTQSFQLQAIDSTWYKIVHTTSGKCVGVAANGTADGANIQLWTCNGTGAQAWKFVASGSYYTIVGQTSNKCIDVSAGGPADGTNIQLWTCNGTSAQNWNPADIMISGARGTSSDCNSKTWACGPDAGCPNGPSYVMGDIVLYQPNGQYYQATHDNGGLDPTVSTWYWSPTTCSGGVDRGVDRGVGRGIAGVVSSAQFNAWFPKRNLLYTYAGLTSINNKYPDFANSSDMTIRKREAAALLANVSHETGDLKYIAELNTANYCHYCDTGKSYGCPAGKCSYYGRGPIQLSWNFNYKAAGDALGYDLLRNPNLVQTNSSISWQTAAWFWNTQAGAGSTPPHNAMLQSSGAYGFGYTIRAINGSLECPSVKPGASNTAARDSRINKYKFFCDQLRVTYGNNLSC